MAHSKCRGALTCRQQKAEVMSEKDRDQITNYLHIIRDQTLHQQAALNSSKIVLVVVDN